MHKYIPPEVQQALDRMCTPLDESRLAGYTAQADAHCMAVLKAHIERMAVVLGHTYDVLEGLQSMPLTLAMPSRVRKLRAAIDAVEAADEAYKSRNPAAADWAIDMGGVDMMPLEGDV